MSLHVKKINRQFSVLKKARVIGLFSCISKLLVIRMAKLFLAVNAAKNVIARFVGLFSCTSKPIADLYIRTYKSEKWKMIARLCRAFFMHVFERTDN